MEFEVFNSTEGWFSLVVENYTTTERGENVTSDGTAITDPGQKVQVSLYGILMPIVGAIVIILNLAVVISSGLIIKKGNFIIEIKFGGAVIVNTQNCSKTLIKFYVLKEKKDYFYGINFNLKIY